MKHKIDKYVRYVNIVKVVLFTKTLNDSSKLYTVWCNGYNWPVRVELSVEFLSKFSHFKIRKFI